MVEVEVRNFQSIERATFRIDGFTVVVGRSNIGKSALVRALKACLTGAPASSFVRHGATCLRRLKQAKTCKCYSSVHIKATDFDLFWEKGDSVNRYTFNGQVYDKAERGTPDFLQPLFSPVKVGDRQELLQVSDQFSPIFLLDQTGGAVADTLSDVARLDRINAAMRLAEKDRKEAVSTRKVREKDVVHLNARLNAYEGLDTVLVNVQRVADKQTLLEKQERALVGLDSFMERTSVLASTIRELTKCADVQVPSSVPLTEGSQRLDALGSYLEKHTERERAVAMLSGVEELPTLPAATLQQHASDFARLGVWLNQVDGLKTWAASWKVVQDLPALSTEPLKNSLKGWDRLNDLLARQKTLETDVAELDLALQDVVKELQSLNEEQAAIGVCPTCTRSLAECSD